MTRGESSPLQKYLRGIARRHELEGLTDAQLLQQYVAGNGDGIAELMKRHYTLVLSACRGHFHDFSDAEEVCVAAFIVLMEKASQKWESSVGAWLYKTARQIANQKQAGITRGKKRQEALKMKKPAPNPAEDLSELCNKLHEELANLAERYRAPVVLCYLEGKSRDEAAKELGLSLRTLDRRKEKGLELSRARLTKRGLTLPAGFLAAALAEQTAAAQTGSLMAKSLAQAAITSVASKGGSEGPLSSAVALAKEFLAQSAKAKGKKILLFSLAMVGLTAGGMFSVHALAPDSPPPPKIQAELEPPQIVVDPDAEAKAKLKTLVPRILRELEHMMLGSKAECLSAEIKKGEAEVVFSWQIFLIFGVNTKSLIRLSYEIDRGGMGCYLDFVGDGGHYRPVDPEMGAYTKFRGKNYSLFGKNGLQAIRKIFAELDRKPMH